MRIIFLDIDGVLNTHEHDPEVLCGKIHPDKMFLLNEILRGTEAKIVLSSAWRYILHRREATIEGLDWLLRSHGLMANRLIGVTREDTMQDGLPLPNERGQQITDYLCNVRCDKYIAIDDLDLGITAAGHPLIKTDDALGLTVADAIRAVELLID